jgi:hypothetical protein
MKGKYFVTLKNSINLYECPRKNTKFSEGIFSILSANIPDYKEKRGLAIFEEGIGLRNVKDIILQISNARKIHVRLLC